MSVVLLLLAVVLVGCATTRSSQSDVRQPVTVAPPSIASAPASPTESPSPPPTPPAATPASPAPATRAAESSTPSPPPPAEAVAVPSPVSPVVAPAPPVVTPMPPAPVVIQPTPVVAPPGAVVTPPSPLDAARALIARGEMAAAARRLRDVLRERPDDVEARLAMAHALHGMGDADGAIEELRAVLRQAPEMSGARLALAAALTAKQDWPGARVELEEALRRDPDLAQAYYTLGLVRYTQGDLSGAIEAYRRVLARDPGLTDARYNLGLMLKLAHRDAESAAELLEAARAGVPRAQYFVGTAYATGAGVERNVALGVEWWFRAAEQGVAQADEALAQLRAVARGRGRRGSLDRAGAEAAFHEFRGRMWIVFPALTRNGAESLGARLVAEGRARDAVPVLIREALALDDSVEPMLESLYENGATPDLAPHDARILRYLHTAAGEGGVTARMALARIYGRGLGVPADVSRAVAWLRPLGGDDAQRLLRELTSAPAGATAPVAPSGATTPASR